MDTKKVPEFSGSSRAYGPERAGVVYLTSDENGTMTELTIDADGKQHPGRVVSFTNLGVDSTSGGNVNVFLSPTKAYHVNQGALLAVVWNPQEMSITTSFSLGLKVAKGYNFRVFGHVPVLVGSKLVLVSNSYKAGADGLAMDQSVVVVDTVTDKVISTVAESRCSGTFEAAKTASGDTYFITNAYEAAIHYKTPELAPAPCILRMKAGKTAFDPGFMRSLDGAVASPLWGSFVEASGGEVLTRVAQESAPEIQAAAAANDIIGAPVWEWWATSPDEGPAHKVRGLPIGGGSLDKFTVDGKSFVLGDDGDGNSVLIDTSSAAPTPGLSVPGYVYNVVRVR